MKEIIISSLDMARLRSHIAKARSGGINAPINLNPLQAELDRAKVLPPEKMPPDVVTMHSIVKLDYLNSDKSMQIQIVYPHEADSRQQKISVFAPVATALLGYRKGDTVRWKVPTGEAELRISEIIYQPEASGDLEL
ncbi:Regulator of nucleoside diphosphate kinase [bioreactor metagenome]|jgi:regulator of nucleoside diphosphate kinase|uniref:Regulator of nucleoside diphosphate kinase n=1 Tax=bioreactor metagenome TaxID=1076179 RepID=A0A644UU13_9ZZZZ|nr:nucleoside diphosphate kinase regulator [Lentimicrobium sp.]MEA5109839.1 nucleoside diphosphate kinase regulator [Lentimicrobium sp.]